ncbi:ferredoxin [Streptomyces sp. NPDC001941]|uniref:ferredoxin n=1 Tax=Streptomyces sp. NPDC001941 TaxID=3154659 RepID=UPI00333411F0
MRVEVDRDRCCGAGMCTLTEPEVFDQSAEDGTVVLLTARPPRESWDGVEECVRLCPSQAISLADGGD